jgi:hypothetical protein
MGAFLFTPSNRLATVFGDDFARHIRQEFEMTVLLNPQVSFGDIFDLLDDEDHAGTALWLDRECVVIVEARFSEESFHCRYRITFRLNSHKPCMIIYLYQVPGATEPGAPLPALEYLITRLTNDERVEAFWIEPSFYEPNRHEPTRRTLDVSPEFFSNLLQTSRLHTYDDERLCSVTLCEITLTAEQTELLFRHDTSSIFIELLWCHFHGPTLLVQAGSEALRQREQTPSYLEITLDDKEIAQISRDELTALLSIPHLRGFIPFFNDDGESGVSSETIKKIIFALAGNKISRLEILYLGAFYADIEWKKEEEPLAWIDLWKAIEGHPSLKEVHLETQPGLCQQSWWQPIAAAVKINPRLVHVEIEFGRDDAIGITWKTKFAQYVEPLLERNRFRPKIASLCCTDPSDAAALLVQAIVTVARHKNAFCRREIHRMLLDQLVLTGYDFGVGRVLGKKRPLAETVVFDDPNDVFATKTEPREADCIIAWKKQQ